MLNLDLDLNLSRGAVHSPAQSAEEESDYLVLGQDPSHLQGQDQGTCLIQVQAQSEDLIQSRRGGHIHDQGRSHVHDQEQGTGQDQGLPNTIMLNTSIQKNHHFLYLKELM